MFDKEQDKRLKGELADGFVRLTELKGGDTAALLKDAREHLMGDLRERGIPTTASHLDAMLFGIALYAQSENERKGLGSVMTSAVMYVLREMQREKDEVMKHI